MLWLWPLRDVTIIGTGSIFLIPALVQDDSPSPLVTTLLFALLNIHVEGADILDLLRYAVNLLLLKQQYYEWGEAVE